MSGKPGERLTVASLAFIFSVLTFVFLAAAIAVAEGVEPIPSGACIVGHWELARALPWLVVAVLPAFFYGYFIFRATDRRPPPPPITVGDGPYRQVEIEVPLRIDRPRSHRYVHGVFAVLALAAGIAESRRWSCPYAVPATCRPKLSRIAIVGVGKVERGMVEEIATHFRDCYRLPVVVAPSIEAPPKAWSGARQQWTAEALLAAMPGCHDGDPLCTDDTLTIGITSDDIYTTQHDWRYAFTIRDSARHSAIISSARTGSTENARKLVAKTIALEYCGLEQVESSRSVRYGSIMGPDDLDAIDESTW
jgi:hypothetical protein